MSSELEAEKKEDTGILPVDHQLIKGKIKHVLASIPALDERWVEDRKFAFYVFPPTKLKNGSYIPGAKETWMTFMSCVLDDIWWLCELPYHKFWSQIIYNKNSVNGIKSFLHLAPLEKLYYKTKDSDILSTYKRIKKAVFQFLKRVSRPKESELHFISDLKYREIMSDHEIIPFSSIFCICSIYGKKYREDVYIIVSQVFKWNNNLKFEKAVLRTIQLFEHLNKRMKISYRELKRNLLRCENSTDVSDATNAYKNCLLATLQFMVNASLTVSNFLSVYKEGCQMFLNHNYDFHIIRVYEKLLIPLAQEIDILFQDCLHTQTYSWLFSLIDLTRLELTKSFEICLISTLQNMSDTRITQDFIKRHIKLMKNALKAEEFLQDLNSYCNVVDIIDKIRKKCPGNLYLSDLDLITDVVKEFLRKTDSDLPTEKKKSPDIDGELVQWNEIIDYVKEYYDSDEDLCSKSENIYANGVDDMFSDDILSDWSDDSNSNSEYESYLAASEEEDDSVLPVKITSFENNTFLGKEKELNSNFTGLSLQHASTSSNYSPNLTLSQVQLQSAIAYVKELLPHLGDGFVAMCLEYYKMDPSAVINAVFEETLPPYLKSIDFSLSKITDDVQQKINSALENSEACDNKDKLKELKRVEYSSYTEMLNDKKEIRDAKGVYESYRNVEEDDLYDDDVDEEIEDVPVAPVEVDPEGFYNEYAKMPLYNCNRSINILQKPPLSDDETEENEETQPLTNGPKPLDFCENPEITRARREHQRQVTMNRKYPRNSHVNSSYGRIRKESNRDNVTNEKHDKSSSKNENEHGSRERRGKFSSQNRNLIKNDEKHDKCDSQNRNTFENRQRCDKFSSQNKNYNKNREIYDKFNSQNRNSYENRDRYNNFSPQNRNTNENRDGYNDSSSQNRNCNENRDRYHDSSSQNRNFNENRDRYHDSSSQNKNFNENRDRYPDSSSQNRNFNENRDRYHDSSSQNRNFNENRDRYLDSSSQNRNFNENQDRYPDSSSQNNNFNENSDRYHDSSSQNRNFNENRDRYYDSSSRNRNFNENRDRYYDSSSRNRNFNENRDRYNNSSSQNSNSYENRSWRSNDRGENMNNDRERHFKNVHKARQANHSRKLFSNRKRQF